MKKGVRNTLLKTFGTEAGQPTEQKGQMLISFSTGQSLAIPLVTRIATPYLIGSAPLLSFGVCHVTQSCQGLFLLSNPTSVPAKWTVTHVPGGGSWKKKTGIRVQGMVEVSEEDDPSVFEVTPDHGSVNGPTVSVNAALFAPSKDQNRMYVRSILAILPIHPPKISYLSVLNVSYLILLFSPLLSCVEHKIMSSLKN